MSKKWKTGNIVSSLGCGINSEMNFYQMKQDMECQISYLSRNKEVRDTILDLKEQSSYEVNSLLDSALGRVMYEIHMNKKSIESLKKGMKKSQKKIKKEDNV